MGASQLAGVLETKYCLVEGTEPDIGASTSEMVEGTELGNGVSTAETQLETNVTSPPPPPLSEQMIPQSGVAGVQASE